MSWKVKTTANDGRKSYVYRDGNNFARVWETHNFFWAVYSGNGNSEVASGSCNNLRDAKTRAAIVLKTLK